MPKKISPEEFAKISLDMIDSDVIKKTGYQQYSAEEDKEIYELLASKKWGKAEQRVLEFLQANPYDIFMRNFLTYIQIKKQEYPVAEMLIQGTEKLDPTELKCKTYYLYICFLLGMQEEVERKRKEIDVILQTPQSENVPNELLYAQEIYFLELLDKARQKKSEDLEISY